MLTRFSWLSYSPKATISYFNVALLKKLLQILKTSIRQHEARHPLDDESITRSTSAWPKSEITAANCSSGIFHAASDKEYPHAHFAPLHYEQNYGYPLWFGCTAAAILKNNSAASCRWSACETTLPLPPAPPAKYRIAPAQVKAFNGNKLTIKSPEAEEGIRAAIASTERRFNIRRDRNFLAGYESGGTMAFRIAAENPDKYAGVLSLCGPFPTEGAPLAKLHTVRRLPLFVAACRNGSYYPTQQVCDNLRLFHSQACRSPCVNIPGEDALSQRMLSDVDRWVMEQIIGPPTTAVIPPHQSGVN